VRTIISRSRPSNQKINIMKTSKSRWIIFTSVCYFLIITACSKSFIENDSFAVEPISAEGPELLSEQNYRLDRQVSYRMGGRYSGKFDFVPILHNSMPINPVKNNTIPWEETFKIPDTSSFIGGYALIDYKEGEIGDSLNLQMYYEEKLLYSVIRTRFVEEISLALDTYHFADHEFEEDIKDENIGKKITYSVSSDNEGPVGVSYQVATGGFENIIVDLPYEYSFIANKKSKAANIFYSGFGLKEVGDKITFKLFVDDVEVKSSSVTKAEENGYSYGEPIWLPLY